MQGLSAEVHRGAIPQDTILKFRKGEIIFSQGDPGDCWFEVISGTVRTCHFHVDGHRQLTGFFYQGDVFTASYAAVPELVRIAAMREGATAQVAVVV